MDEYDLSIKRTELADGTWYVVQIPAIVVAAQSRTALGALEELQRVMMARKLIAKILGTSVFNYLDGDENNDATDFWYKEAQPHG